MKFLFHQVLFTLLFLLCLTQESGALGLSANLGLNYSKTESESRTQNANVASLTSEGDILLRSGGNIDFTGTQVSAGGGVLVDAAGDIVYNQAINKQKGSSSSKSGGITAGYGFTLGLDEGGMTPSGAGFTGSGNYSQSDSSYDNGQVINTLFTSNTGEMIIHAGGDIIDNQNLRDWSRSDSSSIGTGNLSIGFNNFNKRQSNVSGHAIGPAAGGFGQLGDMLGLNALGDTLGGFGNAFGGNFGSALNSFGQSAYSQALNNLLTGDEHSLQNLWQNAAMSGLQGGVANYVAHGPAEEGVWKNSSGAEWLLKPLIHGATQGGIGELFGHEFGAGFQAGVGGSLTGMIARDAQIAMGHRLGDRMHAQVMGQGYDDQLASQLASNISQLIAGLNGADPNFGRQIGENVWEYNDRLDEKLMGDAVIWTAEAKRNTKGTKRNRSRTIYSDINDFTVGYEVGGVVYLRSEYGGGQVNYDDLVQIASGYSDNHTRLNSLINQYEKAGKTEADAYRDYISGIRETIAGLEQTNQKAEYDRLGIYYDERGVIPVKRGENGELLVEMSQDRKSFFNEEYSVGSTYEEYNSVKNVLKGYELVKLDNGEEVFVLSSAGRDYIELSQEIQKSLKEQNDAIRFVTVPMEFVIPGMAYVNYTIDGAVGGEGWNNASLLDSLDLLGASAWLKINKLGDAADLTIDLNKLNDADVPLLFRSGDEVIDSGTSFRYSDELGGQHSDIEVNYTWADTDGDIIFSTSGDTIYFAPNKGGNLFSQTTNGPAMSAAERARFIEMSRRNGVHIETGSGVDNFLTGNGAHAMTFGDDAILLHSKATRSAAFEDFIHLGQKQSGKFTLAQHNQGTPSK